MVLPSAQNILLVSIAAAVCTIESVDAYVSSPNEARNLVPRVSVSDTTNLGSLVVPSIGMGTISWSSNNCM